MKIVLGCPYITKTSEKSRVCCDISGILNMSLWYEVDRNYEQYLCTERIDSFIVGMLPYLFTHSSEDDILDVCCEAPISERLFYQLTVHYIPTLVKCVDWYHTINIVADLDHTRLESAGQVGTGISGGVDSYYSLLKGLNENTPNYRITHGLYGETIDGGIFDRDIQDALRKLSKDICDESGIQFVDVKSNIVTELYNIVHEMTVSSMFLSYVLALQKLFKIYYFSSSHTYQSFEFVDYSSEYHQLFNMYCLSTENTELYVTGAEAIRHEKTEYIAHYELPKKYIMVCRNPILVGEGKVANCSRCSKCTRTMIDLDLAEKLDEFKDVFDIQNFYKHPSYYYGYLFFKGKKDAFIRETLSLIRKKKKRVPIGSRTAGVLNKLGKF